MSRKRAAVRASDIAPELVQLGRRRFLKGGLSLGALTLLTGCDLSTHSGVDAALSAMLEFDDRVQAALFNPNRLAETYPASATSPSASMLIVRNGRPAPYLRSGASTCPA